MDGTIINLFGRDVPDTQSEDESDDFGLEDEWRENAAEVIEQIEVEVHGMKMADTADAYYLHLSEVRRIADRWTT